VQPSGRIDPQPWMTAPQTRAVLAALTGPDLPARFVGGCVRDAVLQRPVKDIDIATPLPPDQVQERLEAAGIQVIPTGLAHGTATAVLDGRHFEITTLRVDVETYGRHARVAFTDDWLADAARRDLTFNALFCDADGTLYDPFDGLADLRQGRVRFIGRAADRIAEDRLRLLRFFRFYAYLGKPPPDAEALAACRAAAPEMGQLSGERVREECLRLLLADEPASVVALMAEHDVLGHVLPHAQGPERLRALVTVEGITVGADAVRRLAAVLHDGAASAAATAERLRLSRAQQKRLHGMLAPEYPLPGLRHRAAALTPELPAAAWRRLLYRMGGRAACDLLLLSWAEALTAASGSVSRFDSEAWRERVAAAQAWKTPRFPLGGADALALGVPRGPRVGTLLDAVEEWWIDAGFAPDREACLQRLAAEED
jgi:poly(A) polymerase